LENIVIVRGVFVVPYSDQSGAVQISIEKRDAETIEEVSYADFTRINDEYNKIKLPGRLKRFL